MGKVLSLQPYVSLEKELAIPALSVSHPAGGSWARVLQAEHS